MLTLLVVEMILLQIGIRDSEIVRRTLIEVTILEKINNIEFLKRSQKSALKYSFYGAYDFLGKRGGYLNLNNVQSYDCIPYWRIYDTTIIPDLKDNIEQTTSIIFNDYMDVFRSTEMIVPYYEINIQNVFPLYSQVMDIEIDTPDDLMFKKEKLRIIEKSVFSHDIPSGLSQEYNIGDENFIQKDSIKKAVEDGINSANTEDEINQKIRDEIEKLEQNIDQSLPANFHVEIEVFQIEKTPTSAAANVLVTIENKDTEYLIENKLKTIPLKFRIIDGDLTITPPTDVCGETI